MFLAEASRCARVCVRCCEDSLHFRGAVGTTCRFDGDCRTAIGTILDEGWTCRRRRRLTFQAINLLNNEKNGEGDDRKINDGVQKQTDVERRRPGRFGLS